MYPIPLREYQARLRKWKAAPDRKVVETMANGRPVTEHWSTGVCRLRMVRLKDGMVLLGDRGVPGYPPKGDVGGKIAFQYFGDAGR